MTARSLLRISLACLAPFTCASTTFAQNSFDDCGTLVPGTFCAVMFRADSGVLYSVGDEVGGFAPGDRVRVTGVLDPLCVPLCQEGAGCVALATVGLCGHGVTALCFGDGTGSVCPCANTGAAGRGCPNSSNAGGARLFATGAPSVSADTLVLVSSGMPGARALYYQAAHTISGGAGFPFGDGLQCAGGSVLRLATVTTPGGASSHPAAGGIPISVRGGVGAGETHFYQVQYRDTASFCTPASYNFTNAIQVTWGA